MLPTRIVVGEETIAIILDVVIVLCEGVYLISQRIFDLGTFPGVGVSGCGNLMSSAPFRKRRS